MSDKDKKIEDVSWLEFMAGVVTDKDLGFVEKLYGLTLGQLLFFAAKGNCKSMKRK